MSWQISVAREPIISSSLLVVKARNKHEWTSEGIVSTAERCQYTPFFTFKSTDNNLLSHLVCLLDKNGRFGVIMIGLTGCQTNSLRSVNWPIRIKYSSKPCNEQAIPMVRLGAILNLRLRGIDLLFYTHCIEVLVLFLFCFLEKCFVSWTIGCQTINRD